ncbi:MULTISPECIES: hypothetical protein [unclassified Bradyrhizobium]|uniref:hypothetical protein n=1 Tax=unclassified Bradyrhizobium TaxID=2631580 RepID=UPI0024794D3C|nr:MULTISPECIES: hypothetical protein [unclassified Bradyrhizobium]WGS21406.1 hypothetical protein MTX22_06655 [Bradyrhizobium sp. ISRA463]WGS28339.1 hypothetical protein MTX19_04505 [Bradyrhizobium sp. ISRA464]
MSSEIATIPRERASVFGEVPAWFLVACGVYALLLLAGSKLLADSDTYWQIAVGRWILDHGTVPSVDIYSFTRAGEPWMSSSWLSQVLYAKAYDLAGWTGPAALAAICIAAAFAQLTAILSGRMPATYASVVALAALALSTPHLLARPHVLVLPVMIAWTNALMVASERRETPTFWLLPLIALWANLHGGFLFGLVLVGAFALDAIWNAAPAQRPSLALRWLAFGVGALAACCVTPYGWGSILASLKILGLGELLHLIGEWMPADFGHIGGFEFVVLALIAAALYGGVRLPLPRIALVLGLLYMALSHVRNIEIFALLLPMVVLTPLASQFGLRAAGVVRLRAAPAFALLVALCISTWAVARSERIAPPPPQSPAAAVDVLKARNVKRVLNDLPFGGYLIWRQVPVFVDGRAELYGETFDIAYYRALQLKDVDRFIDLLRTYDIDAVMLEPTTPAVKLLDRIGGWQRAYADDHAVVYVRTAD